MMREVRWWRCRPRQTAFTSPNQLFGRGGSEHRPTPFGSVRTRSGCAATVHTVSFGTVSPFMHGCMGKSRDRLHSHPHWEKWRTASSFALTTVLPCPPSRFLPPNCFNVSGSAVQPAHAGMVCCMKLQNAAQSPDRVMLVLEVPANHMAMQGTACSWSHGTSPSLEVRRGLVVLRVTPSQASRTSRAAWLVLRIPPCLSCTHSWGTGISLFVRFPRLLVVAQDLVLLDRSTDNEGTPKCVAERHR